MHYVTLAEAQTLVQDPNVDEIAIFKSTVPPYGRPLPDPWVLLDALKDMKAPTGEPVWIFRHPTRRFPQLRHVWNKPDVRPFWFRWWTPLGLVERVLYYQWTGFAWVRVA